MIHNEDNNIFLKQTGDKLRQFILDKINQFKPQQEENNNNNDLRQIVLNKVNQINNQESTKVEYNLNECQVESLAKSELGTSFRNLSTDAITNKNLLQDTTEYGGCFDKENLPVIADREQLFDLLCEILIRFDTTPDNYKKDDYYRLINVLSGSTIQMYNNSIESIKFKGIANFDTNPVEDIMNIGWYMANKDGVYKNFGITLTKDDVTGNLNMFFPIIEQYELKRYDLLQFKFPKGTYIGGYNINIENNVISCTLKPIAAEIIIENFK